MLKRFSGLCLAAGLLIAAGVGCEAQGPKLDEAMSRYNAGDYHASYDLSRQAAQQSSGESQAKANYISGISAYRLGRDAEAIRYLAPLSTSTNAEIAANSSATLGLIHESRRQYDQAAAYYQQAIPKQQGEEQARTHYQLGMALQKLGRTAQAREHLSLAISRSSDAQFQAAVRQHLQTTGFTVQVGAYTQQVNADRRAQYIGPIATRLGLGGPRIVPTITDRGERHFLVQVGAFSTWASAQKAREQMGMKDSTIVPLSQ